MQLRHVVRGIRRHVSYYQFLQSIFDIKKYSDEEALDNVEDNAEYNEKKTSATNEFNKNSND